jgi:LysM repeat protein
MTAMTQRRGDTTPARTSLSADGRPALVSRLARSHQRVMSAMRALVLLSLLLCQPLSSQARAADPEPQQTVVVKRGDTLARIAKRHGLKVEDLRRWNRGRIGKGDSIKAGASLVIKPGKVVKDNGADKVSGDKASLKKASDQGKPLAPPPGTWEDHVMVRRGDSLGKIASRANVDLEALMQWNGLTMRSKIKAGDRLRVFKPGPRPPARSIGRTTAGALEYGQHLGTGPGYRLRFPRNAFGVDGVLKTLKTCARRVRDQFPGSHDILIGDISRPGGGHFPPHSSHQSGRDVDVGYFLASEAQNDTLHRVRADEIDYARTWALLRCYLTSDKVVRVYIDRKIQVAMVAWMRAKRALDDRHFQRLFEVEGGDDALIQHAPKHDTHMHVRFACDSGQEECVEEEKDSIFVL